MAERMKLPKSSYRWAREDEVEVPSYEEIVGTFGEILAGAHEGSYQGDSMYLIESDGRHGIVTFGWGSCSGCDALEACKTQAHVDELQDDLERGIRWFDDYASALNWLREERTPEQPWLVDEGLRKNLLVEIAKANTIVVPESTVRKQIG